MVHAHARVQRPFRVRHHRIHLQRLGYVVELPVTRQQLVVHHSHCFAWVSLQTFAGVTFLARICRRAGAIILAIAVAVAVVRLIAIVLPAFLLLLLIARDILSA
jgi:hypothetical protein